MLVKNGDAVQLRDGTHVLVTDAADQDPDAYRWYAADGVTVNAEMPVETIFVGVTPSGKTVVSDMSEVVTVFN